MTDANGRAGKGTAVRVLEWLLGEDAVGATSFTGFAKDFGLGSLAGKSVALFNEANAQSAVDVPLPAIDRLKMITGNDMVEIERKGVDSIHMRLKLRLLMSCNRMPNFRDPSGALMKRMVLLEFKQTFYGREDETLKLVTGPLHAELPGIFNWAMRGLVMLLFHDKKFIRPDSSKESFEQLERISAPIKAFASDCLVACEHMSGEVDKDELYGVYCAWAVDKEGQQRPMGREKFFAEIRHIFPHRMESRKRIAHGRDESRKRIIYGLSFTEEGKSFIGCHRALFSDGTAT
jgi:P4 family phage/plasmid primase-like protien